MLGKRDKELLQLLARLLVENLDSKAGGNLQADLIPLSDGEADRLAQLLSDLIESREFVEGAFLVEHLSQLEGPKDQNVREVYLRNRKKHGMSRVMSSRKWAEFLARLGTRTGWQPYIPPTPMSDAHFLEMERRLFDAAGIHPLVRNLLLKLVKAQMGRINQAREGKSPIPSGTIRKAIVVPFQELRRAAPRINMTLATNQLAGAMVLISNLAVLFTSRDWSVTGTLSGMGGAFVAMTSSDRR